MMDFVHMRDKAGQPRPVPVHIPKGASHPEDQERPSLLTTLPPELRNEV
jgi:hypothetical protein